MRRQRPTQRQRLAVFIRAGHRCEYCRHPLAFSSDPFEIEHIIPVEQGGRTTLDNLALACRGCNHLKHTLTEALDPATGVIAPSFILAASSGAHTSNGASMQRKFSPSPRQAVRLWRHCSSIEKGYST